MRSGERLGYAGLPVCIAKTPASLSDDPQLRGRPTDFDVTVREIQINAGAGFLVVLTGAIMRMPGLPSSPRAGQIALDGDDIVVATNGGFSCHRPHTGHQADPSSR